MKTIKTVEINYIAVLILVLLNMILGFIWYSPYIFGNEWMRLLGKDMSFFQNAGIMPFIVAFISSVFTIFTIAWVFKQLQIQSFIKGIFYAIVFWFGFLFCELLTIDQMELRHYGLTWINAGKSFVTFVMSGFLLGFWNRFSETKIPDVPPAPEQPKM